MSFRLGTHSGITDYTIGQRRGLNVAVGDPLFVVRLEPETRRVIVGPREALLTGSLTLEETNWLGDEADIQTVARLALETVGGFEVMICGSGAEVLEKAPCSNPISCCATS